MMYIINPWIFYLISLADSFKWASGIIAIITLIISILAYEDDVRLAKILFAIACISCVICLLIPSKDVCYKMLIASQVTTENINNAKETIKDVVDYIIEASKNIGG